MLQSTIKNSPLTIKIIQNKQMLAKKKYLTCKFFIYCSKLNLQIKLGDNYTRKKGDKQKYKTTEEIKNLR